MARISSLAVLASGGGNDYLAEKYGAVVDNIQKDAISARLKNTSLSGTPSSGTVEAKRFENRTSQSYGTARSNGYGTKVTAEPVTIAIDVDRELVTEVEQKDVSLYGVDEFIARQAALDERSMTRELERAFFACAALSGTEHTPVSDDIAEQIEELIQAVENTQNEYVDGVDRDMIAVICDTATYGAIRNKLDTLSNANVDSAAKEIKVFHGVEVYSTVYMPTAVHAIAMVKGSIAQPVLTTMDEAGKFEASNAYHFGMFFSYGTKAVMPDLIYKLSGAAGGLTVTSAAGSASGKTAITISPAAATGNSLYYKTAATVELPLYLSGTTGYSEWDGTSNITATTGNEIVIAEVSGGKIIKAGKATVTSKA